ncbi:MAG: hypothetical protein Q8N87_03765 [bacterium]|nr:hypothetical protein [bacterium]
MKKLVIGRYYFNSLFKDRAGKSFLDDLMKEPFIEEKNFEYALGNFNAEEYEENVLLRGTFGRMRKGDFAKTYDKGKKEFKNKPLPDIADVILEFIINHENHLIFLEYNTLIKPSNFADKFKKIYAHTASIADLEIDFIFIEKDVYETIQKWQKVEQVIFKRLRPSNPSSLDYFKDIEELLKETKSEKTNIEFHGPSAKGSEENVGSLNYESKLIKQGIALSSHGYGEARLKGLEKNGKEVEVESKRFLRKVEVDFTKDGALERIIQTIEEIKKQEDNG